MRKFTAILFLVCCTQPVWAEPSAQWQSDYGTALASTKSEARPLLIVLEHGDQRRPVVSPANFDAREAELLKNYNLCRVDVDTPYGQQTASAFRASEFPHTVIIDKTGSTQIYKRTGTFPRDQWLATLTTYRAGTRVVQAPVAQQFHCSSCGR